MIKAKNLFVIISRDVTTDASDQMTSVLKIIEKFTFGYDGKKMRDDGVSLGDQPLLFPGNYSVATSWILESKLTSDTFLEFKINLIDPDGKDYGGPTQEHLIPKGIDRVNMNFNLSGLPANKSGKYKLKATMCTKEGKEITSGEYPFEIELNDDSSTPKG